MAVTGGPRRGVPPQVQRRLWLALGLMTVAFFVLGWRLYSLQILRGEELASKGRDNYVQRVEVLHDRGIIYDRHGRILVDNRPSLDLTITPQFLGGGKKEGTEVTLRRLAEHVGLPPGEGARIEALVLNRRGLERFRPIRIMRDLSPRQVEAIEADRSIFLLDGVNIIEGRRRTYRYGAAAAHLLGYVNEIGPARLDAEKRSGNPLRYERGDLIGRDGIEHRYETSLRGEDGHEKVVTDAKGRRMHGDYVDSLLGPGRRHDPKPGHNVFLTIDLDLQLRAEQAFDGRAGAVVAIDPKDGAVLALVSMPAFDPNLVSGTLATAEKDRLDADPLKPWVNRAVQGQYAPGSTFKVITAAAALVNRATSPAEKVNCPGYYTLGRRTWRCHKDTGHGRMNLKDAIKYSCDTYFYTMAARMGIDPIAAMGRLFGLGSTTGIQIRGEKKGLMPDETWHNTVEAENGGYQRGMALNTAIGQGSVLVTPLQLAVAYAAFANSGVLYTPKTVARVETADFRVVHRFIGSARPTATEEPLNPDLIQEEIHGEPPAVVSHDEPPEPGTIDLPADAWLAIQTGLIAVASERGGTAYWRRSRIVSMAGKTGTAQVIRLGRERLDTKEVPYEERDHAWFAAWAPAEDPRIVIVVLNEHSGHGGSMAGPIAVAVIDAYFEIAEKQRPRARVQP